MYETYVKWPCLSCYIQVSLSQSGHKQKQTIYFLKRGHANNNYTIRLHHTSTSFIHRFTWLTKQSLQTRTGNTQSGWRNTWGKQLKKVISSKYADCSTHSTFLTYFVLKIICYVVFQSSVLLGVHVWWVWSAQEAQCLVVLRCVWNSHVKYFASVKCNRRSLVCSPTVSGPCPNRGRRPTWPS